jgi:hypothetical protein
MPPVIHQLLDGEVIAVNLDTGVYYSLAGTAAEIWSTLEAGGSPATCTDALLMRYEAQRATVEAAVAGLVEELQQEALLVPAEAPAATSAAPPALGHEPKRPFESPVIHTYTDMQQLLLLDPIHEVDEAGWPHALDAESPQRA